jgi:hypothetical protein
MNLSKHTYFCWQLKQPKGISQFLKARFLVHFLLRIVGWFLVSQQFWPVGTCWDHRSGGLCRVHRSYAETSRASACKQHVPLKNKMDTVHLNSLLYRQFHKIINNKNDSFDISVSSVLWGLRNLWFSSKWCCDVCYGLESSQGSKDSQIDVPEKMEETRIRFRIIQVHSKSNHTTYIFMVMTGGWLKWHYFNHINK